MHRSHQYLWFCACLWFMCSNGSWAGEPSHVDFLILYTNDEHGWMEPVEHFSGAAGMWNVWQTHEDLSQSSHALILSGGDNFTGSAISTWVMGESMIEVMDAMGYSASAIGNHEFDFTEDVLWQRQQQAGFPYLAANLVIRETGQIPEYARAFIVKKVGSVQVGIIGLASRTTPTSTFPDHVKHLDFLPYEDCLRHFVPLAKQQGAQFIAVISHLCRDEMIALVPLARELGIHFFGGGHCHELVAEVHDNIPIVQAGFGMRHYSRVEIRFDLQRQKVLSASARNVPNTDNPPAPRIQSILDHWRVVVDADLAQIIGHTNTTIGMESPIMHDLITRAWLDKYPQADLAMINIKGVRQSIPVGPITMGTIVGVLPFENRLTLMRIPGHLLETFRTFNAFRGNPKQGLPFRHDLSFEPKRDYLVLTTDYVLGAYRDLRNVDVRPQLTSIHWRDPIVDWIRRQHTSSAHPLDQILRTLVEGS